MLLFDDTTFGTHRCIVNLNELYPNADDRHNFVNRFEQFTKSDQANEKIFSLHGDQLIYYTETFISDRIDDRPPVLLLLGNPASHSIEAEMCFAFESGGKEHRFWKGLEKSGILQFPHHLPEITNPEKKNEARQEALLYLNYISPFRVGIAVFHSLPSTSSDPKWSGVSGVKRLLGTKAFRMIGLEEERRIDKVISKFLGNSGGTIAFQKDAYNGVRSLESLEYNRELAAQGSLRGRYRESAHILLAGSPPTRLMHSDQGRTALNLYKNWLCEEL
jgi:hypothetical protein